jgi:hypothetical protein
MINFRNILQPYDTVIKLVIYLGIISGVAVAYLTHRHQVKMLTSTIENLQNEKGILIANSVILKSNNQVLQTNIQSLQSANSTNSQTIQKLIEERADAQQAINNLSATKLKDKKTIAALNKRLNDILSDPKNDGVVSPALRETIRDIQNLRGQK